MSRPFKLRDDTSRIAVETTVCSRAATAIASSRAVVTIVRPGRVPLPSPSESIPSMTPSQLLDFDARPRILGQLRHSTRPAKDPTGQETPSLRCRVQRAGRPRVRGDRGESRRGDSRSQDR